MRKLIKCFAIEWIVTFFRRAEINFVIDEFFKAKFGIRTETIIVHVEIGLSDNKDIN